MPKAKFDSILNREPSEEDLQKGIVSIWCPGCKTKHYLHTKMPNGSGAMWKFNGYFEKPTFSPSLVVKTGIYAGQKLGDENDPEGKRYNDFLRRISTVCHSFIREGKIQFLGDCTHELKNKTVDLIEIN